MITEGLKQLLQENNYTPATIRFMKENGIRSNAFLRKNTEIPDTTWNGDLNISKTNTDSSLNIMMNTFPAESPAARVVHMLEDYRLIRCLPGDTMHPKIHYAECVLFSCIYGLYGLPKLNGIVR